MFSYTPRLASAVQLAHQRDVFSCALLPDRQSEHEAVGVEAARAVDTRTISDRQQQRRFDAPGPVGPAQPRMRSPVSSRSLVSRLIA